MFKKIKKPYLTKEQQIKRSFIKGIAIGTILVIIVGGTYQFVVIPSVRSNTKTKVLKSIENKENEIEIWTLNKDIKQGEVITKENLTAKKYDKQEVPADIFTTDKVIENKVARMNLKVGTIVSESMLTSEQDKLTQDLRNQDYDYIKLNFDLEEGMIVDIRFKKKDGTDFIVASKKKVIKKDGDEFSLNITEEERQYINNATVKAALTEALVYTTKYVDGENQPKAKITYELDENIQELIEKDPNIVKESSEKIKNRDSKENNEEKETKENNKEKNDNGKPVFIE